MNFQEIPLDEMTTELLTSPVGMNCCSDVINSFLTALCKVEIANSAVISSAKLH